MHPDSLHNGPRGARSLRLAASIVRASGISAACVLAAISAATFACGSAAFAQPEVQDPRIAWLREHAVRVRTIDEPPAGTGPDQPAEDFSDLEPLREIIGSARVVGLGEQSHGDGATFKAKCRLVRFLHQKMGFDVLAWESGLFDCRQVDDLFAKGVEPDAAADIAHKHGVFGIWAQSAQARPVLEYAASTHTRPDGRRLIIAGFDNQYTSALSRRAHAKWLDEWFAPLLVSAAPGTGAGGTPALKPELVRAGIEGVRWMAARFKEDGSPPRGDPDKLEESREAVAALAAALEPFAADGAEAASRLPNVAKHESEFVRRTLLNLLAFDRGQREMNRENIHATPIEVLQLRDERMGSNLVFLANEYYKGKKIIAWAASSHLLRNPAECQSLYGREDRGDAYKPQGHFAAEALGKDYFVITFSAFEGKIGRPWSGANPIPRSEPGDLETLLADAGLDLAIVPLNPKGDAAAWLREPQVMRPMGYGRERAVWGRCFDAMFFTRTMMPSTK